MPAPVKLADSPQARNARLRNASMMDSATKSGFATLNESD